MSAGMVEKFNSSSGSAVFTVSRMGQSGGHPGNSSHVGQNRQRGQISSGTHRDELGQGMAGHRGILGRMLGSCFGSLGFGLALSASGSGKLLSEKLPLCSFGPGGSYLVDWRAHVKTEQELVRRGEARTLAAGIERIAETLAFDLKGWLLAEHPERCHRIDSHPATLDGCPLCGHENQWPDWFIQDQPAPDRQMLFAGMRIAEDLKQSLAKDKQASRIVKRVSAGHRLARDLFGDSAKIDASFIEDAATPQEQQQGQQKNSAATESVSTADCRTDSVTQNQNVVAVAEPIDAPTEGSPVHKPDFSQAAEQAVQKDNHTGQKSGIWETEDTGPFLFRYSDNLEPVSFRLPDSIREQAHDTDTQTTQNPDSNPGLPGAQRVLADHAGTGRSAQRLKGNHLRARRSSRAEKSSGACPEQGSLFGNQPDGQAA